MLSIKNVSIEQASTYYSQDNYYTKQRGEFWGKAIEGLGFTKELTHKNFIHMLHGENSAGEKLRREKEDGKTRAGYDHTFTAPKSLSILLEMAEATGNTALAEAIRKIQNDAVNVTLKHIEKNYMYTRTRTENGRVHEQTTNLIAKQYTKYENSLVSIKSEYENSLISIKSEYEKTLKDMEQSLANSLNKIANQYTKKLKELCDSEALESDLESDLEKRLTTLERDLSSLKTILASDFLQLEESLKTTRDNQSILLNQLKISNT